MYTSLLIFFFSFLSSILASDRGYLGMMFGMPHGVPEARNQINSPSDRETLMAKGLLNYPNPGSYQDVEKKWSKPPKFHFSGFICCNQPPTPHPKTKRERRTNDDNLRSILLKAISRSMARNRIDEERTPLLETDNNSPISQNLGGISYLDFNPSLVNSMPLKEDVGDFLGSDGQFYPDIQRRGVTEKYVPKEAGRKLMTPGVKKRRGNTLSRHPFYLLQRDAIRSNLGLEGGNLSKRENSSNDFVETFQPPVGF